MRLDEGYGIAYNMLFIGNAIDMDETTESLD
jgi:hypothetical protein